MKTTATALAAALALGLAPAARAADQILIGLADRTSLDTFRSVLQTTLAGQDPTYSDLSPRGLIAGTNEETDADGKVIRTDEARAVFRPTLYANPGAYAGWQVVEVDVLLGGGMGSLHTVQRNWGGGSSPQEIFDLPVDLEAPPTDEVLVEMFQSILDSRGSSGLTSGLMIRSTQPLAQGPNYSARFSVRVREAIPWSITGGVRTLPNGSQVLEFRSSRRGRATFTINGVEQLIDQPVARDSTYRYGIPPGSLVTGANSLVVTIRDPLDGSSQTLSVTLNA